MGFRSPIRVLELYLHAANSLSLRTFSSRVFGEAFFANACEVQLTCRRPFPALSSFPTKIGEWENSNSLENLSPSALVAFAECCLLDVHLSDDFPLFGLRLSTSLPPLPPPSSSPPPSSLASFPRSPRFFPPFPPPTPGSSPLPVVLLLNSGAALPTQ